MKVKVKIRKALLQDVEIIAYFNQKMAEETKSKKFEDQTVIKGVKSVIKDPRKGFYLVAEVSGNIVGQLMVTNEWSDWRNKYFYWISSVYVQKEFREQGIFSALFFHLKNIALYNKNIAGLRLYVEKNNENAKSIYERLGMFNTGYELYETNF